MRGPDARVESALSIGRDVTAMRKGESDHRRLRLRMATALEDERRRIARELHNSLSQHLTALVLDLHALRYAGRDQHDIGSRLLRLQEVADRIAREAHRVTMELRPLALDDLGLKSAMRGLVEQWSEQHDVMPHTRLMGLESPRLPPVVETTVYRLVHEGLANVGKHAQATDVGIIVERRGDEVVVILEDDGRGFDVEATMGQPPTGHLGLSGMRDRVELCDGTLTIESMSGEGTTLIARIPLTGPEA
jgi:signal transduction histidine kinase